LCSLLTAVHYTLESIKQSVWDSTIVVSKNTAQNERYLHHIFDNEESFDEE